MARKDRLNCLEKRDLLNQAAVSVESLMQWGERYEEAGLLSDAVDFYEKANAGEALLRVLETAKEEGDLFLFARVCRILKREPGSEEWGALARQAEKLGKQVNAAQAYLRSNPEGQAGKNGAGSSA